MAVMYNIIVFMFFHWQGWEASSEYSLIHGQSRFLETHWLLTYKSIWRWPSRKSEAKEPEDGAKKGAGGDVDEEDEDWITHLILLSSGSSRTFTL